MGIEFLEESELPVGIEYPGALKRLVERGVVYLEPWYLLEQGQARERFSGLKERFPGKDLVPFARREDNDDVACLAPSCRGKVVVIHDFSSDGWERRVELEFYDWLRAAVEAMIEFDELEEV